MPSEQFSQAVRGSGAEPIQTNSTGTMQTDNYQHGDAFSDDGTGYPVTINPAAVIQELILTKTGDIDAEIETIQGDTFQLRIAGTVGSWEGWEIDRVTFRDTRATGADLAGGWAGE